MCLFQGWFQSGGGILPCGGGGPMWLGPGEGTWDMLGGPLGGGFPGCGIL